MFNLAVFRGKNIADIYIHLLKYWWKKKIVRKRHKGQVEIEVLESRLLRSPPLSTQSGKPLVFNVPRDLPSTLGRQLKPSSQNHNAFNDWAKVNQCESNKTACSSKIN